MLPQCRIIALVASLTLTYVVNAIPTAAPQQPSTSPPVLYNWSTDPACASTTTKADCSAAVAAVCTSGKLSENQKQSVAECTAWYFISAGDPVPTQEQCQTTFSKILASDNAFGLLGYNAAETRTGDPLYAIYPAKGNGNCFKAPGDVSPVLAMDVLPKSNLTLAQCGNKKKNERALEERGAAACIIENLGWQTFCNGACLSTVVATSWLTGPFAVAGWASCLGLCDYTGYKVGHQCFEALEPTEKSPSGNKLKRALPMTSPLKCVGLKKTSFDCPSWESALKSEYGCEGIASKDRKGASLRVS